MKIISAEHGQILHRFIAEEVRPPSGLYIPDLIRVVAERYGFISLPRLEDAIKEGAKFSTGRHLHGGRLIEIKTLGIFSDGILVVTLNTDDASIILDELLQWIDSIGFRRPTTIFPRQFVSSVIVDFDRSIDRSFDMLKAFNRSFSEALYAAYGYSLDPSIRRIAFACDPLNLPPQAVAEFTLERRAGVPFSQNRYFSAAPLPTKVHLDLLQSFEKLLIAN